MKKKDLVSCLDSEDRKEYLMTQSPVKSWRNDTNRDDIKDFLSEQYGSTNSKYLKQVGMASTLQNSKFYKETKGKDVQDKEIQMYEIEAKIGFDKLETADFKNLFTRKGIHIYDLLAKGKHTDGNDSGNITFKIRKKSKRRI